jgi:chromosome partitioning protein
VSDNCIVITITNSKGGVGKTTTAVNLGAALATEQKRVLLIDNDVQGNLTAALGYTPSEQKYTLGKILLSAIDTLEDLDLHLPKTTPDR